MERLWNRFSGAARLFICAAVCLLIFSEAVSAAPREPWITAEAAIVVEASTGRVVYEKNADRLMHPASLTKMMTCILAIENTSMDSTVVISPSAAATEDTWLDDAAGRAVRMGDLVEEMMIVSDNGAAVAIAEQMASSVPAFADKMTKKARDIGASKTRFANPNGLTEAQHVSTARDMMMIARYGWNNPEFRRIAGMRKKDVYWQSPRTLGLSVETTNELLGVYPGMAGLKTGWTNAAGGCFAGAATRGNVTLISIVLNAPDTKDRFRDTVKLMDYGFSRVRVTKGPVKEQLGQSVWVHDGSTYKVTAHPREDIRYVLFDNERSDRCGYRMEMPRFIHAPIKAGDKVGELVVTYDGKETGRIDMVADESMGKGFSPIGEIVGFAELLLSPILG
ncbi:D-alanyl-D-alanine carboxypeptidase family protein [Schwartzia sp. (in: firmicutes)]